MALDIIFHKRPLSSSTRLLKAFSTLTSSSFGGSTKTLVKKNSLHLMHLSTTVESGLPLPAATAWPIEELIVSSALLLL